MEYNLATKTNEGHATTRMNLEEASYKGPTDCIYRKCPESANLQRQKADQWMPGAGSGEKMSSAC